MNFLQTQAELCTKTELVNTTRDHKRKFEVPEGLPVFKDLHGHPVLKGDGDSVGSVLSPRVSLIEAVEPRKKEGSSLLLICTMLGIERRTSPHPRLCWGRRAVFAVILG